VISLTPDFIWSFTPPYICSFAIILLTSFPSEASKGNSSIPIKWTSNLSLYYIFKADADSDPINPDPIIAIPFLTYPA
jgi:hypothetical protein